MTISELTFDSLTDSECTDNPFVRTIQRHQAFFHRSLECLTEEDSNFRPADNMLSVAGQVVHVVMAIEFFLSGMFGSYDGFGPLSRRDRGFTDMDWVDIANNRDLDVELDADVWLKAVEASQSLTKALALFDQTMETAAKMFSSKTFQQIQTEQLPENPVFPPFFRYPDILEVMNDHTAHHRGALVVYAHFLGREPKIPYFEMSEAFQDLQRIQSMN